MSHTNQSAAISVANLVEISTRARTRYVEARKHARTLAAEAVRLCMRLFPSQQIGSDGRHLVFLAVAAEQFEVKDILTVRDIVEIVLAEVTAPNRSSQLSDLELARCDGAASVCVAFQRLVTGTRLERSTVIVSSEALIELLAVSVTEPPQGGATAEALNLYARYAPFFGRHVHAEGASRFWTTEDHASLEARERLCAFVRQLPVVKEDIDERRLNVAALDGLNLQELRDKALEIGERYATADNRLPRPASPPAAQTVMAAAVVAAPPRPAYCHFCRRDGHTIDVCRSVDVGRELYLQYREQRKGEQQRQARSSKKRSGVELSGPSKPSHKIDHSKNG